MKVGLFIPCYINAIYPNVGVASVSYTHLTCTVIPPSAPVPGMINVVVRVQFGRSGEKIPVECATDRPIWPQGLNSPEKADRIPNTLN